MALYHKVRFSHLILYNIHRHLVEMDLYNPLVVSASQFHNLHRNLTTPSIRTNLHGLKEINSYILSR